MKLYLETPTLERKEDVVDYINEHAKYGSNINGSGSFDKILEGLTYEECLDNVIKMKDNKYAESINKCPGETYFLVRKEDKKLFY